jgi:uncharacterized membrane protein
MATEVNTTDTNKEKPVWLRAKFIYAIVIAVLVYAAIVTLVLCGKATVTSEQIISFAEWVLGFLVGGHAATDITARIAAIFAKPTPAEPVPAPVTPDDPSEDR